VNGRDGESIKLFLPNGETKYFCALDWTDGIRLIGFDKSRFKNFGLWSKVPANNDDP
jgi:hypothetical protein